MPTPPRMLFPTEGKCLQNWTNPEIILKSFIKFYPRDLICWCVNAQGIRFRSNGARPSRHGRWTLRGGKAAAENLIWTQQHRSRNHTHGHCVVSRSTRYSLTVCVLVSTSTWCNMTRDAYRDTLIEISPVLLENDFFIIWYLNAVYNRNLSSATVHRKHKSLSWAIVWILLEPTKSFDIWLTHAG